MLTHGPPKGLSVLATNALLLLLCCLNPLLSDCRSMSTSASHSAPLAMLGPSTYVRCTIVSCFRAPSAALTTLLVTSIAMSD